MLEFQQVFQYAWSALGDDGLLYVIHQVNPHHFSFSVYEGLFSLPYHAPPSVDSRSFGSGDAAERAANAYPSLSHLPIRGSVRMFAALEEVGL